MELLNTDISTLSYKIIKEKVDKLIIKDILKDDSLNILIKKLELDSRKNVQSLGSKIKKQKKKIEDEIIRVQNMYNFDKSFGSFKYVAGVDEVGRGPLAGPIVSAAVILDLNVLEEDLILGLNDSKKISKKKREELSEIIKKKALAYSIKEASNKEIDEKGIAYCNNKVFLEACNSVNIKPDLVLSDGYLIKNINIENKSVIKGDTKSACIAAASIIAKVYRDNLMKEYSIKYPNYGFEENVGYGTESHVKHIKEVGPCDIHRLSFLKNILEF
ncbi:ribonuclease HII [Clostridium septicum]|uniref:Ribonuclease HII n=1 Tax=Clostridium septicum TaxID=1504 RepID=A0A9N7JIA6_CLOSE|nr:ribonuclease HII [Clostridium septicum]AYE33088.1 ribonuclease HII [Clostridium septicum]MDU1313505.1 ribonuclease HII [Clostridium septicum]QAS61257.1 ribonuclease HII [Clostridium septicum]UEC19391.1 ribonuclease HII [Clostridium septicum]USR99655.1 ribonuclease HII [Clostridium septicum]